MEMEIYEMSYQIETNSNELRISGEEFVINNRNKGFLIIKTKNII